MAKDRELAMSTLCRVCNNESSKIFSKKVLKKYNVDYFKCSYCNGIQTEEPFWLDEAYLSHLVELDFGVIRRNIENLSKIHCLRRFLSPMNIFLDYGGGDGLLCRMLRDYEIDCYNYDKYSDSPYAQQFIADDEIRPDVVTAFEVIEHFKNPQDDFKKILKFDSEYILMTTSLIDFIPENQIEDWWYVAEDGGQHLFLYTQKSLEIIAKQNNYYCYILNINNILFSRHKISKLKLLFLKLLNKSKILKIYYSILSLTPANGVWKDYENGK
jgi:hypothetical protein